MQRLKGKIPDLVVSIMLLVVGAVGLVMALDFPTKSGKWPIIIMSMLTILMLLYLASFIYDLSKSNVTNQSIVSDEQNHPAPDKLRIVINIAIITAFIILAPILGLFFTLACYLFIHMLFLGVRPIWLAALSTLGCTAVIYGFFGHLLGVYIPNSLLF